MPQSEARAWWADVQHVRESIERRRAGDAEHGAWSPGHDTGEAAKAAGAAQARRRASAPADTDHATRSRPHVDAERPRVRPPRVAAEHAASTGERRRGADWLDPDHAPAASAVARRTVQITGRPAAAPSVARLVEVERRRPTRTPADRFGARPDRVALWAVLLAFFLIVVALTS